MHVFFACLVFTVLLIATGSVAGQKNTLAVMIGGLAGFALYHAAFGFTSAWRRVITEGKGGGLRSQFLLIILTSLISFPLIAHGGLIGFPAVGSVAPIGIAMIFGAFLFGFGMMFGGGCGSGTLFTAGGGNTRMMMTLAAFIAGSLLGTFHLPWWQSLPRMSGWSMIENFGPLGGLLFLTAILALISWLTIVREKSLFGETQKSIRTVSYLRGPWSPMAGVIGIAIVGIATFLLLGRPWGITSGFALWGAKIASLVGRRCRKLAILAKSLGFAGTKCFLGRNIGDEFRDHGGRDDRGYFGW